MSYDKIHFLIEKPQTDFKFEKIASKILNEEMNINNIKNIEVKIGDTEESKYCKSCSKIKSKKKQCGHCAFFFCENCRTKYRDPQDKKKKSFRICFPCKSNVIRVKLWDEFKIVKESKKSKYEENLKFVQKKENKIENLKNIISAKEMNFNQEKINLDFVEHENEVKFSILKKNLEQLIKKEIDLMEQEEKIEKKIEEFEKETEKLIAEKESINRKIEIEKIENSNYWENESSIKKKLVSIIENIYSLKGIKKSAQIKNDVIITNKESNRNSVFFKSKAPYKKRHEMTDPNSCSCKCLIF